MPEAPRMPIPAWVLINGLGCRSPSEAEDIGTGVILAYGKDLRSGNNAVTIRLQ